MNTIRFYNTLNDNSIVEGARNIWVPDSNDFQHYFNFYRKHSDGIKIKVEQKLLRWITDDAETFSIAESNASQKSSKIILYAQSDTLAHSSKKLAEHLSVESIFSFPSYLDEAAESYFKQNKLEAIVMSYSLLKEAKPDALVLFNDWSKEAKRIISMCRFLHVPTICLQESIIDFGDHKRRMMHSDYSFVQGIQTVFDLNKRDQYIVGNPRYAFQLNQNSGLECDALINCNFTYNIFEEIRDSWINDITEVLSKASLDFRISQHPRDLGDLSRFGTKVLPSGAAVVDEQIGKSATIITRFSSLVHEAILQGKNVIYYNPHGETMQYDFRFNQRFLHYCTNREELAAAINYIQENKESLSKDDKLIYGIEHCLPSYKSVYDNFNDVFSSIKFSPVKFRIKDFYNFVRYNQVLLKTIRLIKPIKKH